MTMCLGYMAMLPFSKKAYVSASSANVGAKLTIKGLKTTAKINQTLSIPKAVASTGTASVVIKNPRGKVVSDFVSATETEVTFKPTMLGYYTVQYLSSDGITKSQIYSIKVEGDKPTLSFADNAKVYLPKTIYAEKSVILPTPVITEGETTISESDIVLLALGETNDATTNPESKAYDVRVSVTAPDYSSVQLTRDNSNNLVFSAIKDNSENYVYGTYTVTYTYASSTGLSATKYASIVVDKDYQEYVDKIGKDVSANLTFVWKNSESMPTSAVLGDKLTLPTPVLQNKLDSNAELQSYAQVEVKFITNGNLSDTENIKTYEVNQQDFSFTPTDETVSGGYYQIKYTITDYFGHTISQTYKLTNVSDTVKPTIYLVADYTDSSDVDLTDLSYQIPNKSIVSSDTAIVLPAIYATDNYSSAEDIKLTRSFIDDSNTSITLDSTIGNTSLTLKYDDEELNSTVKNCLRKAGTYTIRYTATDKANNTTTKDFTLVVQENFVDNTAPRITLPTISSVGFEGETVTFKAPTVVDYASDSLQESSVDSVRCKVEVGYYVGSSYETFLQAYKNGDDISSYISSGEYNTISKLEDDENYYSFVVPSNVNQLHIVVRATDNAKYAEINDVVAQNNIAVKDFDMRVVKTTTNQTAPEFDLSQISDQLGEAGQNEKVSITSNQADSKFTFTGENQDFTTVSVNVYDPSGNSVSVRGASTEVSTKSIDNDTITLSGGYFTSSTSGEYVVTLTAKDISGNITVVAYKYKINDTVAPNVEVSSVPTTVTVGEETDLITSVAVIDDGKDITKDLGTTLTVSFDGYDNPSYDYNHATGKFVAKETGTFTFKYIAKDSANNTMEVVKTITATANTTTDENALGFDDTSFEPNAKLVAKLDNQGAETGKYEAIKIPYLETKNAVDGIKAESYKVKVTNPSGEEISVTVYDDQTTYYGEFEPTAKDGKYTITYSVQDNAGNTAELSKTLAVGDLINPTITIKNEDTNLPTSAKLNSYLKINSSDISFSDNITDGLKLTVTVKDASGSTTTLIEKNGYYTKSDGENYQFTSAGTYTLTYTATDKAGNKKTVSTDIVVKAEGADETTTATILAGVIITLVVVLAVGIVIYFVVVNKKIAPKKDSKDKLKKQD